MSFVESEVAVETSFFVALVLVVAEVTLLSRTDVAAVASVLDDVYRLASRRVLGTLARILALAWIL